MTQVHVIGLLRGAGPCPEPNGPALLYGAAREMLCNLTARGPWPVVCLHSVTFVEPKKEACQSRRVKRAGVEQP